MLLFVIIAGAATLLPGYLLCRSWRCGATLPASLIVSLVVLYEAIFLLQITGVAIRIGAVAVAMTVITAACAIVGHVTRHRQPAGPSDTPSAEPPSTETSNDHPRRRVIERVMIAACLAVLGLLTLRLCLVPLTGLDTMFRWDRLALLMLREGNLDYYPPRTAADFHLYFFADGHAPLASFGHYLMYAIYAALSPSDASPPEVVTSLLVVMQVAALGWLIARTVILHTSSTIAGCAAVLLAASSYTMLWAVSMGQENGLIALSVVGVYYFLFQGERADDRWRAVALAACAATLGALSREYGVAIPVIGLIAARGLGYSWRQLATFAGVCAALGASWYVRNWVLTGNPIYTIDFAGLFPVNEVYAAIARGYQQRGGLTLTMIGIAVVFFAIRMGLVLVVGIAGFVAGAPRRGVLAVGVLILTVLWLKAIGYTYGWQYSTKVLTPVLAIMAIVGVCAAWQHRHRIPGGSKTCGSVIVIAALMAMLNAALYPKPPFDQPPTAWPGMVTARYLTAPDFEWDLLKAFIRAEVPRDQRILSESGYAHMLLGGVGYDVVPPWSPEVAFLFDPAVDRDERLRRLAELRITLVIDYPHRLADIYLDSEPFYGEKYGWTKLSESADWTVYRVGPSQVKRPAVTHDAVPMVLTPVVTTASPVGVSERADRPAR
ncbi:MAG: hypothetical protein GC159_16630 [Phycisphaera sp.]|nr:hypothetical protein [Phycisphaera sp.]